MYNDRSFYIVSALPAGRYLEISDSVNPNNVMIKTRNGRKHQEWYYDGKTRTIRSRANNKCLDIQNKGTGRNMQLGNPTGAWFQKFCYKEQHFVNTGANNNWLKALDVEGGKDAEGQNVIVWNKHNGANQKWRMVYVDEAPAIKNEGYNEDYGMHCNRPFYLRSQLPMKRVAECHGANNVWLRRWRKNTTAQ
jgi:hypothetical protein